MGGRWKQKKVIHMRDRNWKGVFEDDPPEFHPAWTGGSKYLAKEATHEVGRKGRLSGDVT